LEGGVARTCGSEHSRWWVWWTRKGNFEFNKYGEFFISWETIRRAPVSSTVNLTRHRHHYAKLW